MSTEFLPPHLQAKLERSVPDLYRQLSMYAGFVRGDKKRDPQDPNGSYLAVRTLVMKLRAQIGDDHIDDMYAAALSVLADTGWSLPEEDLSAIPPLAVAEPQRPQSKPRPRGR